jgi:hypothetical protein
MTKSRADVSRNVENSGSRALLVAGVAVLLGASTGCNSEPPDEAAFTPKPKPPWSSEEYSSTRLVLRHENGGFKVISSTSSHGGVTQLDVSEAIPEILEGKKNLYEYTLRNSDGDVLAAGYFAIPVTARATFTEAEDPARIHHQELEDPSPIVRVAIPLAPAIATVEFKKLVPDENRRYQTWKKETAGKVRINVTPAGQQPKGA